MVNLLEVNVGIISNRGISSPKDGHTSGQSRETPGIKVSRRDVSKKVWALTDVKLPKTLFYQNGQTERERERERAELMDQI